MGVNLQRGTDTNMMGYPYGPKFAPYPAPGNQRVQIQQQQIQQQQPCPISIQQPTFPAACSVVSWRSPPASAINTQKPNYVSSISSSDSSYIYSSFSTATPRGRSRQHKQRSRKLRSISPPNSTEGHHHHRRRRRRRKKRRKIKTTRREGEKRREDEGGHRRRHRRRRHHTRGEGVNTKNSEAVNSSSANVNNNTNTIDNINRNSSSRRRSHHLSSQAERRSQEKFLKTTESIRNIRGDDHLRNARGCEVNTKGVTPPQIRRKSFSSSSSTSFSSSAGISAARKLTKRPSDFTRPTPPLLTGAADEREVKDTHPQPFKEIIKAIYNNKNKDIDRQQQHEKEEKLRRRRSKRHHHDSPHHASHRHHRGHEENSHLERKLTRELQSDGKPHLSKEKQREREKEKEIIQSSRSRHHRRRALSSRSDSLRSRSPHNRDRNISHIAVTPTKGSKKQEGQKEKENGTGMTPKNKSQFKSLMDLLRFQRKPKMTPSALQDTQEVSTKSPQLPPRAVTANEHKRKKENKSEGKLLKRHDESTTRRHTRGSPRTSSSKSSESSNTRSLSNFPSCGGAEKENKSKKGFSILKFLRRKKPTPPQHNKSPVANKFQLPSENAVVPTSENTSRHQNYRRRKSKSHNRHHDNSSSSSSNRSKSKSREKNRNFRTSRWKVDEKSKHVSNGKVNQLTPTIIAYTTPVFLQNPSQPPPIY